MSRVVVRERVAVFFGKRNGGDREGGRNSEAGAVVQPIAGRLYPAVAVVARRARTLSSTCSAAAIR